MRHRRDLSASGDTRRVELEGEYDLARKDEVEAILRGFDGDGSIVIDLAKVTYVDSTFLSELAALRQRDLQRSIALVGANRHIRHLLRVVNFDRIFRIADE